VKNELLVIIVSDDTSTENYCYSSKETVKNARMIHSFPYCQKNYL